MRILARVPTKIQVRHTNADGEVASGGAVTVVVTDGDGEQVAAGAATEDAGTYSFDLPAQSVLDHLETTWTSDQGWVRVTHVDVVGDRLVDLATMREDHALKSKDVATLRRLQDEVEVRFSEILGFPVVPQALRTTVLGGGPRLLIPRLLYPLDLYSVSADGTAVTIADLSAKWGWLEYSDGRSWPYARPVQVHASYGLDDAPQDLRTEGLNYARYLAKTPDAKIPERATRVITEGADLSLQTPDDDHPTGIPSVDAVLVDRRIRLPV